MSGSVKVGVRDFAEILRKRLGHRRNFRRLRRWVSEKYLIQPICWSCSKNAAGEFYISLGMRRARHLAGLFFAFRCAHLCFRSACLCYVVRLTLL